MAERDAALREVVGRKLERNAVARENADVMLAHLAVRVGNEFVSVVELDAIARVGQDFENLPRHLNEVFLGHKYPVTRADRPRKRTATTMLPPFKIHLRQSIS